MSTRASNINIPANLRWTQAKAEKAAQGGGFLRVGGDTKAVGTRSITRARDNWDKGLETDIIYNTAYGVSGTPRDVIDALRFAGVPEDELQRIEDESWNIDNYKSAEFDRFIEQQSGLRKTRAQQTKVEGKRDIVSLEYLMFFSDNIGKARVVKDDKPPTTRAASTKAQQAKEVDLRAKVQDAEARGMYIDVSNMKENGTGTRLVKAPVAGSKTGKFYVVGLPFVSNSYESFRAAMEKVFSQKDIDEWDRDVRDASLRNRENVLALSAKRAASPRARRTSQSPTRSTSTRARGASKSPTRQALGSRGGAPKRTTGTSTRGTSRSPTRRTGQSPVRSGATPTRVSPTRIASQRPSPTRIGTQSQRASPTRGPGARAVGSVPSRTTSPTRAAAGVGARGGVSPKRQ